MSIKRTKQRSFSRRPGSDDADFGFLSSNGPEKSWEDQTKDQADAAFVPYALTNKFAKGAFILHPKFGKGVVVTVEGSHVIVLFAEGQKKLGHAKSTQPPPPRPRPFDPDTVTEPADVDADPAAALAQEVLAAAQKSPAAAAAVGEPAIASDTPDDAEPR